jgi:hypothetical protein
MDQRTFCCLQAQELALVPVNQCGQDGPSGTASSRRVSAKTRGTGANSSARSRTPVDSFGGRATMALRGTVCSVVIGAGILAGVTAQVTFVDRVAHELASATAKLDQGGGIAGCQGGGIAG